ncbi:MAG: hypothetical protein BWZ02_03214 [Lentisphaerae bacterium ADurb.BinA184]|nr:MAG: hypothetical protein BWZ02_03214 [Lentisphaerae bacterium ADurb.BinA184]
MKSFHRTGMVAAMAAALMVFVALPAQRAFAGHHDHGWETAGKILTGVFAAQVLLGALSCGCDGPSTCTHYGVAEPCARTVVVEPCYVPSVGVCVLSGPHYRHGCGPRFTTGWPYRRPAVVHHYSSPPPRPRPHYGARPGPSHGPSRPAAPRPSGGGRPGPGYSGVYRSGGHGGPPRGGR